MFHGKISVSSVLLLLVSFVSGFRLELMYMSLIVSIRSNHFFHLYLQNKSSESNAKFGQASNRCKRVPEAAELTYATKTKDPSLPRNLALKTLGELLTVFSTKVNLLELHYLKARRC